MEKAEKPVAWLSGEVKTPPFSKEARIEAGSLLRRLQRGETVGMPHVRPMPQLERGCFELRVRDETQTWRLMLRLDDDAVVIVDVFSKKTRATPKKVLEACRQRLRRYDEITRE